MKFPLIFQSLTLICLSGPLLGSAEILPIRIPYPSAPAASVFHMGTATSPSGETLTNDSVSLLRNGKPWMPVMGEFHYSRYPEGEWREELLKMKAGGINIVATYVFWIHHEEHEGVWNWSGQRDLRRFVQTCADVGLDVVVRAGPWCHGEVRNGGIPDWAVNKYGSKLRTNDPLYLEAAAELYHQIARQLDGLLWKQGGPVVGLQLENEYRGPAEHLLELKRLAIAAGIDVPYYTRTGWPSLSTLMPEGEILPLYGAYSEGFWDRSLTSMPGTYFAGFRFSRYRTDAAIANEQLGKRESKDDADVSLYPYLTCEIGGGMMNSYHRRILIDPLDILSVVTTKIGSGGNLPGYYMYHGGTNPDADTTLNEAQNTLMTNWNDMPVKNYDFQAPLGEFGQVREHYHMLRRLHMFVDTVGEDLCRMPVYLPEQRPMDESDVDTLRWAVRSNGQAGFVFINNYQRSQPMPEHDGVQFKLSLTDGEVLLPDSPVKIPADCTLIWPFDLKLSDGVVLKYATAQPVCSLTSDKTTTWFFAQVADVPARFSFSEHAVKLSEKTHGLIPVGDCEPSFEPIAKIISDAGQTVQVVLLSDKDSLGLWKADFDDNPRVIFTKANLIVDHDLIQLNSTDRSALAASVYPKINNKSESDGGFQKLNTTLADDLNQPTGFLNTMKLQDAGPLRAITIGVKKVAEAPVDQDFAQAARWQIELPENINSDALLKIDYVGDVARIYLNGKLLTDDFYNGRIWEIGLKRFQDQLKDGKLEIAILPLQKDAPVFLAKDVRASLPDQNAVCELRSVSLVPSYHAEAKLP